MESRDITQKEIAEKCGIQRSMLSHYLNRGTAPSVITAKKIADFLNVTVDWLIGDEEIKPQIVSEPLARYLAGTEAEICKEIKHLDDGKKDLLLKLIREMINKE